MRMLQRAQVELWSSSSSSSALVLALASALALEQALGLVSGRASDKESGKASDKESGKASDKEWGKESDKASGRASERASVAAECAASGWAVVSPCWPTLHQLFHPRWSRVASVAPSAPNSTRAKPPFAFPKATRDSARARHRFRHKS